MGDVAAVYRLNPGCQPSGFVSRSVYVCVQRHTALRLASAGIGVCLKPLHTVAPVTEPLGFSARKPVENAPFTTQANEIEKRLLLLLDKSRPKLKGRSCYSADRVSQHSVAVCCSWNLIDIQGPFNTAKSHWSLTSSAGEKAF